MYIFFKKGLSLLQYSKSIPNIKYKSALKKLKQS